MTGEIINLRRRRKRKAREEEENRAAANRARFGERKQDEAHREAEAEMESRRLDGHKIGD
jgi:Domain of unknown function (DUF4169)